MQDRTDSRSGDHSQDPSEESARAVHDWLQRASEDAGDPVEILYTTAIRVGVDYWRDDVLAGELRNFAEQQAHLLRARATEESGQVFFVTDLVEEPEGRVRLATSLGRSWSQLGLEVVLVDADLRFVGLERCLSSDTGDAEGFVDALEYGASGTPLLRPSPCEGVRVLPVGSYRPDHPHPLADEALRRLVRQLRDSADVVVFLAPAWTAEGRFHPLFAHSDSVVLGFDLDRSLEEALGELRRYLHGLGIPLLAMAARVSSDPAVDAALQHPRSEDPASLATPRSDSPYADSSTRRDDVDASSPIVRNVLVAMVVALMAFVGWWGWTEWSGRDAAGPPISVTDATPRFESPPVVPDSSQARSDSISTGSVGQLQPETAPAREEPVVTAPDAAKAVSETVAEGSALQDSAPRDAEREIPAELLLAPHDGWALHPWSFADSTEAAGSLFALERQGMQPVIRSAEIKGSTWYRVLVGNFSTRSEAWAIREVLASKITTDWIGVVRVSE